MSDGGYTKPTMREDFRINRNKGASIALVVLAILGIIFIAQFAGLDVRTSWPVLAIILIAVIILSGGK